MSNVIIQAIFSKDTKKENDKSHIEMKCILKNVPF